MEFFWSKDFVCSFVVLSFFFCLFIHINENFTIDDTPDTASEKIDMVLKDLN